MLGFAVLAQVSDFSGMQRPLIFWSGRTWPGVVVLVRWGDVGQQPTSTQSQFPFHKNTPYQVSSSLNRWEYPRHILPDEFYIILAVD